MHPPGCATLRPLPDWRAPRLPFRTEEPPLSTSFLIIDPGSATPPFEQIRAQVVDAVNSGVLVPGSRLPTVRALALELGLAANTVARAYRELEAAAVLETRGRNGSFIAASGDLAEREARVAAMAYADRVRQLGMTDDQAAAFLRDALHR
jgi:DNA-binding transcriptional regulator YhcF (GntR family)